jgi:hypothetical protein
MAMLPVIHLTGGMAILIFIAHDLYKFDYDTIAGS